MSAASAITESGLGYRYWYGKDRKYAELWFHAPERPEVREARALFGG
jgi:hypothetical protein